MEDRLVRDAALERKNLLELLASLETQLALTQAQIRSTKAKLRAVDSLLVEFERVQDQGRVDRIHSERVSIKTHGLISSGNRRSRRAAIDAMMDLVERLILEAGRPLSRTALLSRLREKGFEVEGTDKSKVLGTNLWRSQRFHNLKGVGYWPLAYPLPEEFAGVAARSSKLLERSSN